MLRVQSQRVEEEIHFLRLSERNRAIEQSRQAAIDRFYEGGELRRLLHPQTPTIHRPMLRTSVPDSCVVTGDALSLQTVAMDLAHIGGLTLQCQAGSVSISAIRPTDLLPTVASPLRTIRLLEAGPRLAHSAKDRLCAWEHSLMLEATAQQAVCICCLGKKVTPVTDMGGGC
jgi:hypothetical protein